MHYVVRTVGAPARRGRKGDKHMSPLRLNAELVVPQHQREVDFVIASM